MAIILFCSKHFNSKKYLKIWTLLGNWKYGQYLPNTSKALTWIIWFKTESIYASNRWRAMKYENPVLTICGKNYIRLFLNFTRKMWIAPFCRFHVSKSHHRSNERFSFVECPTKISNTFVGFQLVAYKNHIVQAFHQIFRNDRSFFRHIHKQ